MHYLTDYNSVNSVIEYESSRVVRDTRSIENIESGLSYKLGLFESRTIKKFQEINSHILSRILAGQGLLTQISSADHLLKDENLSSVIGYLGQLINSTISLKTYIEQLIEHDKANRLKILTITDTLLIDHLETLYSIQRVLKRNNKQHPTSSSQLAIDSARRSANTLQKVLYGN